MIFVDSSVWIDYFNGRSTPQVEYLDGLSSSDILTGDLVLCEVLQGFRDQAFHDRVLRDLLQLVVVEVAGREIAIAAAANYRHLRRRGLTMRKTIDSLIATRCILDGYELLDSDRDFDGFVQHMGLRRALAVS